MPDIAVSPADDTPLRSALLDALTDWCATPTAAASQWADLIHARIIPVTETMFLTTGPDATDEQIAAFRTETLARITASTLIADIIAAGPDARTPDWAGVSGDGTPWLTRLDLIAAHEAQVAAMQGAVAAHPTRVKVWHAHKDLTTRDTHREADGQTVPAGAPFDVGAAYLQYPGDPAGPGEEVLHCRCTMTLREDRPMTTTAAVTVDTRLPYAPRDAPWDGPGAGKRMREWATADGELAPKKLATGYVWSTDGPPSSWKLLVADVFDGTPHLVFAGVSAAAGALDGARSPIDLTPGEIATAKASVSRLYREAADAFDDDLIEAPWDRQGPTTAAAGEHTGAMIALVPTTEDAARLAIKGGEPAEELHLTLYFLGEGAHWSEEQRNELIDNVRARAAYLAPVTSRSFGANHWNAGSDCPSWVWAVGDDRDRDEDAPTLSSAHREATYALEDRHGPDTPVQHAPWVPHVCAAYSDDPALLTELEERLGLITFDRLRVAFADEYVDVPLGLTSTTASTVQRTVMATALASAIDEVADEWTPPAAWFQPPDGSQQELISLEGRVAGYVATWRDTDGTAMSHAGYAPAGEFVPVPRGGSYGYFHQDNVLLTLDDGSKVHPGLLTTDVGHGNPTAALDAQVAHYDNPQAIAAAVVVGEDDTGVWVAGAVLPQVRRDEDRLTRLRLTPVSGHWSETQRNGPMELIAVTAVNKPGYPQRSKAGYMLAASLLAAAGGVDLPAFREQLLTVLAAVDSMLGDTPVPVTAAAEPGQVDEKPEAAADQVDELAEADTSEDGELAETVTKADETPGSYPDGVDRELVTAALAIIEMTPLRTLRAASVPTADLPQCLQILARYLEEGGAEPQASRAASVRAAEAICTSSDISDPTVRMRACRLVSEYRVRSGVK